jgi:hypothetical protein
MAISKPMTVRQFLATIIGGGVDLDAVMLVPNVEYVAPKEGEENDIIEATPEFVPVRTANVSDDQDEIQLSA